MELYRPPRPSSIWKAAQSVKSSGKADLERLPLNELCWEEWLENELKDEERLRERDDPDPV